MSKETIHTEANEIDWKDILKVGAIIGGIIWAGTEINKAVVNSNRKNDALEAFHEQDLSLWDRAVLKDWFKNHDFYVTKFPQTHRKIFPLAVKILYKLILYHSQPRLDRALGMEIIRDCNVLHQLGTRLQIYPINLSWPYWMLVADRRLPRNTLFGHRFRYGYVQRPTWNLNTVLNGDETLEDSLQWLARGENLNEITQLSQFPGIVRSGLFGIDSAKKMDFAYYSKKAFGKLGPGVEVDETEQDKTLQLVYDKIGDRKYVAKIYDPKHFDGPDNPVIYLSDKNDEKCIDKITGPYLKGKPLKASERTVMERDSPAWRKAVNELKAAYLKRKHDGVNYNYRVHTRKDAEDLLKEACRNRNRAGEKDPHPFLGILIKHSTPNNCYAGSNAKLEYGYEIHTFKGACERNAVTNDLPHLKFWDKRYGKSTIDGHIFFDELITNIEDEKCIS